MGKKISLICIVNKQDVYDGFLESLGTQNFKDYELLPVMNMHNEYDGARPAFNEAAAKAQGEYMVFIHPDIRFLDDDALGDIITWCDSIGSFGVAGAAGAAPDGNGGREILTTILQGADRSPVGRSIEREEAVQTLDECLFIVKRKFFKEHPFSQRKGWHLYGVEYCLDAIRQGEKVYAVPSRVWHLSAGASLNEQYMEQLEELIEEIAGDTELLCTTVKAWKTRGSSAKAYRKYYYYKQLIKRKVKK